VESTSYRRIERGSDTGRHYPETGLSDITLNWMMSKAKNLGLQIVDSVWAQYAPLDAKFALAPIHESWNLVWGFPKTRSVANNSLVSNSVEIRSEYAATYNPEI